MVYYQGIGTPMVVVKTVANHYKLPKREKYWLTYVYDKPSEFLFFSLALTLLDFWQAIILALPNSKKLSDTRIYMML